MSNLTRCPDCEAVVSKLAASCPKCGRPLAAPKGKPTSPATWGCAAVIALVALCWWVGKAGRDSAPSSVPSARVAVAPKPVIAVPIAEEELDRDNPAKIGELAILELNRKRDTEIPVAGDFFAFGQLMKSIQASDEEGAVELARARRLWFVPFGTRIRVIENNRNPLVADGAPYTEARVIDGELRNKSVFVATAYVIRLKKQDR
jgi:hypothetical protein